MIKAGRIIIGLSCLTILVTSKMFAQDDLIVLSGKWIEYSDAPNSFYHHITNEAYRLLDEREKKIAGIKTPEEWKTRQSFILETLNDIVGPFPDKTPLNAKTVRAVDKGSYRIEHVIFESQPGFYVTSSLFIPAGIKKGSKSPVIIYCSGHSEDGYRSAVYQHVILNLVQKGFIVFAFDPVGQGERLEYPDPKTGRSIVGGPTKEHSWPGAQAFLTGSSQAMYMIWDGIRAVDYLLTRKEIDPERIGITGRSGGGTQSAYIAAFDDRILAAAPENYITNYKRLLQTIGPQDAEQNLFHILYRGLDHPDFLIVRAPKPALMITTTNDMFSIQGAMDTEIQVAEAYKSFGKPENFSRVEDVAGHASTLKNREAMYAFFRKHLANQGSSKDEETPLLSADELKVTPTGQVSTSFRSETVFSINRKRAEKLEVILNEQRKDLPVFLAETVRSAKILSGYNGPEKVDRPVLAGTIVRENYIIEKYLVRGEGDYVIPYLLFRPNKSGTEATIYLHPSGKGAEALPGGEIEKLVSKGIMVLAPDLIGTGETGPGILQGDAYFQGVSHNLWYAAMICGRSLAGIRAGDVVRLTMVLKNYNNINRVTGFAKGEMSPVLIHAAAFSPLIEKIILNEPSTSYLAIVKERMYAPSLIMNSVPGSLEKYELDDLIDAIKPREVVIIK